MSEYESTAEDIAAFALIRAMQAQVAELTKERNDARPIHDVTQQAVRMIGDVLAQIIVDNSHIFVGGQAQAIASITRIEEALALVRINKEHGL